MFHHHCIVIRYDLAIFHDQQQYQLIISGQVSQQQVVPLGLPTKVGTAKPFPTSTNKVDPGRAPGGTCHPAILIGISVVAWLAVVNLGCSNCKFFCMISTLPTLKLINLSCPLHQYHVWKVVSPTFANPICPNITSISFSSWLILVPPESSKCIFQISRWVVEPPCWNIPHRHYLQLQGPDSSPLAALPVATFLSNQGRRSWLKSLLSGRQNNCCMGAYRSTHKKGFWGGGTTTQQR